MDENHREEINARDKLIAKLETKIEALKSQLEISESELLNDEVFDNTNNELPKILPTNTES